MNAGISFTNGFHLREGGLNTERYGADKDSEGEDEDDERRAAKKDDESPHNMLANQC